MKLSKHYNLCIQIDKSDFLVTNQWLFGNKLYNLSLPNICVIRSFLKDNKGQSMSWISKYYLITLNAEGLTWTKVHPANSTIMQKLSTIRKRTAVRWLSVSWIVGVDILPFSSSTSPSLRSVAEEPALRLSSTCDDCARKDLLSSSFQVIFPDKLPFSGSLH